MERRLPSSTNASQQHPFFQSAQYYRIFTDPTTGEVYPQMRGGEIQRIPLHDRLYATRKRRAEKGLVKSNEPDPVQFKKPRQRTCYSDLPIEMIQQIGEKIDHFPSIECFGATERIAYVNIKHTSTKIREITQSIAAPYLPNPLWRNYSEYTLLLLLETILQKVGQYMSRELEVILDEMLLSSPNDYSEPYDKSFIFIKVIQRNGNMSEYDVCLLFGDERKLLMDVHEEMDHFATQYQVDHILVPFLRVLRIILETLCMDFCYNPRSTIPEIMKGKLRGWGVE